MDWEGDSTAGDCAGGVGTDALWEPEVLVCTVHALVELFAAAVLRSFI